MNSPIYTKTENLKTISSHCLSLLIDDFAHCDSVDDVDNALLDLAEAMDELMIILTKNGKILEYSEVVEILNQEQFGFWVDYWVF